MRGVAKPCRGDTPAAFRALRMAFLIRNASWKNSVNRPHIFGKNKGEKKLDMTAPVTQTAAPVKLEMTAPVTQAATAGGQHLVQFVLPRDVTLATAPEPLDRRIRLREVPANRVAVIRYSGFWTQANDEEHLEKLKAILRGAHIEWVGEPVLSRYDPPFKPWFLRRNEIWLTLGNS